MFLFFGSVANVRFQLFLEEDIHYKILGREMAQG